MRKSGLIFAILIALGVSAYLLQQKSPVESPSTTENIEDQKANENPENQKETGPQTKSEYDDFSHQFMVDYGNSDVTPQKDVSQVFNMLQSYFSLVKTKDPLPLGSNREITTALTGENAYRTRVLDPQSSWINQNGELIDRWKTPLYFHAIDAKNVGIRSAGPDQKMWTNDDLIDTPAAEPTR